MARWATEKRSRCCGRRTPHSHDRPRPRNPYLRFQQPCSADVDVVRHARLRLRTNQELIVPIVPIVPKLHLSGGLFGTHLLFDRPDFMLIVPAPSRGTPRIGLEPAVGTMFSPRYPSGTRRECEPVPLASSTASTSTIPPVARPLTGICGR